MARRTKAAARRENVDIGEPGYALGIAAFIASFFVGLVGFILGIVAVVQSRKAGKRNILAVLGIVIGGLQTAFVIVVSVALFGLLIHALSYCNDHPNARQCGQQEQGYSDGYDMPMGDGRQTY